MKSFFSLFLFLVIGFTEHIVGQNYPVIGAYTVIPSFYGPVMVPTKFVTATTIFNQGLHFGTTFTVIPAGPGGAGKIELRGCYYDEQILPTTQTFIDTFYVGVLPVGNYSVTFKAYLSSYGSCNPVDSNSISFLHVVPIVESLNEWNESERPIIYSVPEEQELIIESGHKNGYWFEIRDLNGKAVKEIILDQETTRVNLRQVQTGIYFYRVLNENRKILFRGKLIL